MNKKNLIVGAGICGITLARLLAEELRQSVTVIDVSVHIGGQCYDYKDPSTGITVHKYGPHIFRTDDASVWAFLSRFTAWRPYVHKVLADVNGRQIPLPFNINSLYACFEPARAQLLENKLTARFGPATAVPILELKKEQDPDLRLLADYIYQHIFLNYTRKQWGFLPEELDPAVTGSVPVYTGRDDRYFRHAFQGVPQGGYTALFKNMLAHPLIDVRLHTPYRAEMAAEFDRIFYTGPIDEFFGYRLGELPYRSLRFELKTLPAVHVQKAAVVNYPGEQPYTRITEYKWFLEEDSDHTVLAYEYPEAFSRRKNGRYYPVMAPAARALYRQYAACAEQLKNVVFMGRLGDYKYYNMAAAVTRAFEVFKSLAGRQ